MQSGLCLEPAEKFFVSKANLFQLLLVSSSSSTQSDQLSWMLQTGISSEVFEKALAANPQAESTIPTCTRTNDYDQEG